MTEKSGSSRGPMGAMIDGAPLGDLGGRVRHQAAALDRAAQELDAGQAVSAEISELFAAAALPRWLYRLAGQAGWVAQAAQRGSVLEPWDHPSESG